MTSNTLEPAATDERLTSFELDRGHSYLDQTNHGIQGALRNVSESQWKYKAGPDRWSIAEIVEHVALVQELVLGPLQEKWKDAPVTPAHPDFRHIDDIIIYQIPNRLRKYPSPVPVAGGLTLLQALDRLASNYAALHDRLETAGLRDRSVDSPPLKAVSDGAYDAMDGYQWVLAAAAHTERHTKQILEVMADPRFPSQG